MPGLGTIPYRRLFYFRNVLSQRFADVRNFLLRELALGYAEKQLIGLIYNEILIVFSKLQKEWPLKLR